jgi:polar amino acid transport system substrate-binding protein
MAILRRLFLAALVLLAGHAAASAQTLAQIRAKGKLVVGVMVDVPPFAILDENRQPAGYDIEIAKLLAQRIGLPLDMVVVTGPNRIPYLVTGKVDLLVAVLGIIPERTKLVSFSIPYAGFSQFVYGPKAKKITGPEDLKDLTIGVPRANTSDIALTKVAPKSATILRFDDDASVRQALAARQVDVVTASVSGLPALEKLVGVGTYERKFDLLTQVQGVAVRLGQSELVDWLNEAIADMKAKGVLEELNRKWTGLPLPDLSMPPS